MLVKLRELTAVLACLVLLACSAENRLPGHVYYWLGSDPTTLDPALIVDVPGGSIAAKLFNGLVRLGDDLGVRPDIARAWSLSDDGLTYTFELRKGVRFSNGREVRAADFKYSFERVLDPATRSPRTWILDKVLGAGEFMKGDAGEVAGIRVVDDYTLQIRLAEPFSPFLGLLTMPNAYVVPREEVERLGPDFSTSPVGTGPYVLDQWLHNRHLVLKSREDYFDGRAAVAGLFYRVIPEELTAVAEFELGNIDVLSVPASAYSLYSRSPKWRSRMESAEGLNTYYLGLNCSRRPFDNPALRRAVSMAVDREKILRTLYEGRGHLAGGPVPGVLRKWPAPAPYAYDPGGAREIVEREAAGGDEVLFYVSADQQVVDIAEVIQAYLEDAGFRVKIVQLEWSAFKHAVNSGEADLFWLSWWADYPDPENFLFPLFHSSNHGPGGNRVFYANPEVDALIVAGQRATDVELRNGYYQKAEGLVVRDAPWVFFWHKTDYMIRQPWVGRAATYPVYSMDKGLDIELSGTPGR